MRFKNIVLVIYLIFVRYMTSKTKTLKTSFIGHRPELTVYPICKCSIILHILISCVSVRLFVRKLMSEKHETKLILHSRPHRTMLQCVFSILHDRAKLIIYVKLTYLKSTQYRRIFFCMNSYKRCSVFLRLTPTASKN